MSQHVVTVTQINEYIRVMMNEDRLLSNVAVKGEISNYKLYPSGHHYFTLKDEGGSLRCVMFKGNAIRMKFRPENGMKIIALGKITVFPRDGAYQLQCVSLVLDGIGDLYAAFEQLKNKLSAQGLFEQSHKKPIPKYPATVGIITSSAGAAVHDMLRILRKRYPLAKVVLLPVRVQGVEAPEEIASAISYVNHFRMADVLIVGRGGGSIEDLWAFNDERVARSIYASEIPIISAVGHEPDVTISDFVADLRAATPSNAAELVVPDQDALRQILDAHTQTLAGCMLRRIQNAKKHLQVLSESAPMQGPEAYLNQRRHMIDLLHNRLASSQQLHLGKHKQHFISLTAKLDAMSPLKVLTRGYSILENEDNRVIRSVADVCKGEQVRVSLSDGQVYATVTEIRENKQ